LSENSETVEVPKPKERRVPAYRTVSGNLYEAIEYNGDLTFLAYKVGKFTTIAPINIPPENPIVCLKPIGRREVPYNYYRFEKLPETPPTKEELYKEVYREFKCFISIEDAYLHLFSAFTLLTYQLEKFFSVPYLFITGDTGSGKTTLLTVFSELCYRPLFGVSIPAADIFTFLGQFDENSPGTIIEDEVQGLERDPEKLKIYKSGYRRGAKVPRILHQTRLIQYYPCYGVKILGSEDLIDDKGFQRRVIVVRMMEGDPEEILTQTLRENPAYFSNLRNRLLAWRVAGCPDGGNSTIKLPKVLGDLIDIWEPIIQTAQKTPGQKPMVNLLKHGFYNKYKEYAYSVEGHLARILNEYYLQSDPKLPLPFELIWNQFVAKTNATVIPNRRTALLPDGREVSKRMLAKKLVVIFGGKRKIIPIPTVDEGWTTKVAYEFEPEKLKMSVKRYLKWDIIHEKLTKFY